MGIKGTRRVFRISKKREMPLGARRVATFKRKKDSRRGWERPTPEVLK